MGYVTDNLMSNERVIHVGKVHWFVFAPSVMLFLLTFLFASAPQSNEDPSILVGIFFFLAILSLIKALIFKISTELAVTNKRVIAKVGLISRKTIELNHNKVESFNIDQSVLGRVFGFGTIMVCGTGGAKTPIPSIAQPLEFRKQAMIAVDETSSSNPTLDAQ